MELVRLLPDHSMHKYVKIRVVMRKVNLDLIPPNDPTQNWLKVDPPDRRNPLLPSRPGLAGRNHGCPVLPSLFGDHDG